MSLELLSYYDINAYLYYIQYTYNLHFLPFFKLYHSCTIKRIFDFLNARFKNS